MAKQTDFVCLSDVFGLFEKNLESKGVSLPPIKGFFFGHLDPEIKRAWMFRNNIYFSLVGRAGKNKIPLRIGVEDFQVLKELLETGADILWPLRETCVGPATHKEDAYYRASDILGAASLKDNKSIQSHDLLVDALKRAIQETVTEEVLVAANLWVPRKQEPNKKLTP